VVFVFNPLPGGGDSTSVEFPIAALSPIISFIRPASVTAAQSGVTLQVFGSNFVASSVINFNGAPLSTTFVIPTALTAQITPAQIVATGTATISVTTPSNGIPGGGTSNTAMLTIVPPPPPFSVSSISPISATAGDPGFTLTVNGTGFVSASQVSFNLMNMVTSVVSPTELTATIPASAIAIAGQPYVIVTNPNGITSTRLQFTVFNRPPGVGAITPPSGPAGSGDLILNVTGTGFVQGPSGSTVYVNSTSRVTKYMSPTLLQATLTATDLAQGGTLNITVVNLGPGGGTSPVINFTVTDYSLTAPLSSPPVTAGKTAQFALTLSPSNGMFSDPVTLSISPATPLPAGANATFAPTNPVTPGASSQIVTLSITTTPHSAASTTNPPHGSLPILPLPLVAGIEIALTGLVLVASGGRGRRLAPRLLLSFLFVTAAGMAACGVVGNGASSPPQLNPTTGTPAGSYPVTVNATSGGVSHSTNITLTVM
jgi:hypothetical protein